MNSNRMRELLFKAVDHIQSFEGDEFQNVMKCIGFKENEIKEIIYVSEILDFKNEKICAPNKDGIKYLNEIGGDNKFHNKINDYDLYVYKEGGYWIGIVYYGENENYVDQFDSLIKCLNWLTK